MSATEGTEASYWLHVPLETTRGDWLDAPADKRVVVLGKSAKLLERELMLPYAGSSVATAVVKQWLLFDPLPEGEARALLDELRARLQVLALRQQTGLRVVAIVVSVAPDGRYNGPRPTLIPATVVPDPAWAEGQVTNYTKGDHVLGKALDDCPAVTDERLRAALDLAAASHYDALPRSVFLAQLTILDALAVRKERPAAIQTWLDGKIVEAQSLNDEGLISSLENLKRGSHGSAVRSLVSRAARASGMPPKEVRALAALAGRLFGVRSNLSHSGGSEGLDIEGARRLVGIVINAAVANQSILDAE